MNQAVSTPGADLLPETTDLFTAGHFALMAVLAVLVIAGLVWGIRNKRRRRTAEHEVLTHNAEVKAQTKVAEPAAPASGFADDEGDFRPKNLSTAEANAPTELLFEPLPDASARYAEAPSEDVAAEPVPEAPVVEARPDVGAAIVATPPASAPVDGPVTQLKGLGPKLATRLADLGITTVGQVAALTDDEAAALDARLGPFTGRMGRDRWQEQARFLAAGDREGFEAVFGRL